jgi:hypothetical protein
MTEEAQSPTAGNDRLWAGVQPTAPAEGAGGAVPAVAAPAAGWYQNPQGPGQRYWDGSQWTEHYSGAGVAGPSVGRAASSGQPGSFWVAVASVGAMLIGAFGPWVTALGGAVSVSGTTGGRDGWILVGAAALAAVFLFTYASKGLSSRLTGAVVFAVIGALVCVYDLADISNTGQADIFGTQVQVAHAGWGIYLGLAGSAALAVSAVVSRQREAG